ncbi:hypothetical protein ACQR3P_30515 [Rhodococcus sp. IEGM1300]
MANSISVVRKSFRDPATGLLKAHGYMDRNDEGDLEREEAEDFLLQPRLWRMEKGGWVKAEPSDETIIAWPNLK